jgi:hypothetical protein
MHSGYRVWLSAVFCLVGKSETNELNFSWIFIQFYLFFPANYSEQIQHYKLQAKLLNFLTLGNIYVDIMFKTNIYHKNIYLFIFADEYCRDKYFC